MTKRHIAMFGLMFLALPISSDLTRQAGVARAGQSSGVSRTQQTQPAGGTPITWEYRILYGTTLRLASLESDINDYATQGFVVDSFQVVSNTTDAAPVRVDQFGNRTYDSRFQVNNFSGLIVLLKRMKH